MIVDEEEEDEDEGGGVGKRAFFCRSTVELDPDGRGGFKIFQNFLRLRVPFWMRGLFCSISRALPFIPLFSQNNNKKEVPLMLPYEFVDANVARKELGEIRGMVNGRFAPQHIFFFFFFAHLTFSCLLEGCGAIEGSIGGFGYACLS